MRKILYLLLVSFFVIAPSSWGACSHSNNTIIYSLSDIGKGGSPSCFSCPETYYQDGRYYYNGISELGVGSATFVPCNQSSIESYCNPPDALICACGDWVLCSRKCKYNYYCTTELEAQEQNCELQGGQWNGTECVQGDTTSCETYEKECAEMGGTFSGTPLKNGCSAVCDVCNSEALKIIKKAWDVGCCNQQLTPPDSVENQICLTPLESGQGMTLSTGCLTQDNCNCGVPLNENLEFDYGVYARKCGSAEGGSNPNSSASEGGGGSSSSGANEDSSEVPMVQVMGLEGLMDSLHKIIYNTAEVDTTTQFMLMCMQNPELYCPSLLGSSSSGDTIIIEGDTTIVNVPSDSAIIAEVSENIKNQGARTRHKLDSMTNSLLDSMSMNDSAYRAFDSSANYHRDSLLGIIGAVQVVEGNETQALLDSVVGRLDGVLNELAGLGNDSVGQDSIVLDLPDTTLDLGGADTATIRGTIDSLSEWVSSIVSPDSMGGWGNQNTDGSYGDGTGYGFGITASDNEKAVEQVGGFIRGQLDTGAISDVLDTLEGWHGKFDFGVSASTGGCPSALTRTYSVTIAGATFEIGGVGQYLCTPISGINTTMWDIGRMLLRAVVSIMCFLWLFKVCTSEGKED